MSVTIIVEITNKLLPHVSTHEVSSSGSLLVLAKITVVHTQRTPQRFHIRPHTQFVIFINFNELFNSCRGSRGIAPLILNFGNRWR